MFQHSWRGLTLTGCVLGSRAVSPQVHFISTPQILNLYHGRGWRGGCVFLTRDKGGPDTDLQSERVDGGEGGVGGGGGGGITAICGTLACAGAAGVTVAVSCRKLPGPDSASCALSRTSSAAEMRASMRVASSQKARGAPVRGCNASCCRT